MHSGDVGADADMIPPLPGSVQRGDRIAMGSHEGIDGDGRSIIGGVARFRPAKRTVRCGVQVSTTGDVWRFAVGSHVSREQSCVASANLP